jgi:asparagine synthase (glutamine-hydrolysing)
MYQQQDNLSRDYNKVRVNIRQAGFAERPRQLLVVLVRAVRSTPGDGLLLSGGIDSSLLAALNRKLPTITVVLEGVSSNLKPYCDSGCTTCPGFETYPLGCGADFKFAKQVVEYLGLEWYPVEISEGEALRNLSELVTLTQSYDLALLNDITIYTGLKRARSLGWHTVWTGDDADTLFAGYSYLRSKQDWAGYLRRAIPHIQDVGPDASRIGKALGLSLQYPYLHSEVLAFAQSLDLAENIEWRESQGAGAFLDQFDTDLMQQKVKPWGKAILRHAAGDFLPASIAWRLKTDLEFGSGMCRLEGKLAESLSPQDSEEIDSTKRRFWNNAHRALFLIYKRMGFQSGTPQAGEYPCTWCGSGVVDGTRHCKVCGGSPADV